MEVKLHINLERFRYGLVGRGYTLEEVVSFSQERLVAILESLVIGKIHHEYIRGYHKGFYDKEAAKNVLE